MQTSKRIEEELALSKEEAISEYEGITKIIGITYSLLADKISEMISLSKGENIFTLKISTDFMHERLKPEVLWSFTDDNQGRLSPKVTYEIRDNLWLTLGVHYFYGNEWDTNGQYRDQNQIYTNLKYTF
jgi:hypothetical protein